MKRTVNAALVVLAVMIIVGVTLFQYSPALTRWLVDPVAPETVGSHNKAVVLVSGDLARVEWFLPGGEVMPRFDWVEISSLEVNSSLAVDLKYDQESGKLLVKDVGNFSAQRLIMALMFIPRFVLIALGTVGLISLVACYRARRVHALALRHQSVS